jgi:GNAT superfamily N-acetyltransferase
VLELRAVGYDHPDVAVLVAAVQREYVQRYGDEDATPVEPAEFAPPHGFFTVGYVAGRPVACGGWRARDGRSDESLRDGDAEVKRMFVRAEHRGRGHGRAVLAELERAAAAAGRRRVVLETGTRQPEAIALYTSAGYVPTATFGLYRHSPNCRCYAKILPRYG